MDVTGDRDAAGPVLVTGGTGTLGRWVVAGLRERGVPVRTLSRHAPERTGAGVEHIPGDLVTGEGVPRAVAGTGVIVHCAGNAKGDELMTRTLLAAIDRSGGSTPHLVYISVVGADRVPVRSRADRAIFGYYGAKRTAEQLVARSGLPYSILRATQFHDLVLTMLRSLTKMPVVPSLSGVQVQSIDAAEVAGRLVEIALGAPAGMLPEMGGPQIVPMKDVIRGYLRATGRRRPVLTLRAPGAAYRTVRAGAALAPDRAVGRRTWDEFLADRMP